MAILILFCAYTFMCVRYGSLVECIDDTVNAHGLPATIVLHIVVIVWILWAMSFLIGKLGTL
jgi:hypothetical protein